MMADANRAFRTWTTAFSAEDDLPEAKVRATIAERRLWKRLRSPVQSIYITIPSRGDTVARTETYDGGRVIVEFDADGEVMGLELLSCVPYDKTPQMMALLKKPHPAVLCQSFFSAHHLWHDIELTVKVASEVGDEMPKAGLLRRASPEFRTWSPLARKHAVRGDALACNA